jgi:hypothetical protein
MVVLIVIGVWVLATFGWVCLACANAELMEDVEYGDE